MTSYNPFASHGRFVATLSSVPTQPNYLYYYNYNSYISSVLIDPPLTSTTHSDCSDSPAAAGFWYTFDDCSMVPDAPHPTNIPSLLSPSLSLSVSLPPFISPLSPCAYAVVAAVIDDKAHLMKCR